MSRLSFPGLHRPSIRGRAWADRGPLLLTGAVITLTTLLASAVPILMPRTGDEAVHDAVAQAGPDAALVVTAPFEPEYGEAGKRTRPGLTAEVVTDSMSSAALVLSPELDAVLRPPFAAVTTDDLGLSGFGPGRVMQLSFITGENGPPAVTWIDGGPPKATVPKNKRDKVIQSDQVWPVQVALSETTAAQLKLHPGDPIEAQTRTNVPVDVRVSGIFRPVDPQDPTWQAAPRLLKPVSGFDGTGTRIELAAMMSADSVPDGRLAVPVEQITRTITFTPEPKMLGWKTSAALAAEVLKLKAGSGSIGGDTLFRWDSGLDRVLTTARAQIIAAAQQASVLLVALIGTATLVLLLAADLLIRRRTLILGSARMRGASLVGIGLELLVESIAVTFAGVALGLIGSLILTGDYAWPWLTPIALVAVLGGPVLGVRAAARATQGRQAPANRSSRQSALRTRQMRRIALESAVLLSVAAAFAALHERGVVSATPEGNGGNLLSAIAPTLGGIGGALILLRLMPLGVRLALNRAVRYRGSLPLFAAARAAVTAAQPLPVIVLVLSSALLTFSLSLAATARDGQEQGAWRTVGGDARVDVAASESVGAIAERIAAENGVDQALSVHLTDNLTVSSDLSTVYARLVVVDTAEFARLLAATPLPDAPELSRLTSETGTRAGPVPALLRTTDDTFHAGTDLTTVWNKQPIELTDLGPGPAVGDGEGAVLIVDAAAFAAAGAVAEPNTVWVRGPGARAASAAVIGTKGRITERAQVLADRRNAPLATGISRLAWATVAVLLLFGLLSVGLGAAAGAPARGEMLARLRTLGLQPGQARHVAFGELLPPVLGGALGGLLIGALLARVSLGQLALRLLTGQAADPDLVVPWLSLVPVLLLVLAVAVVVGVESSLRRRERLGQVLRAGNQ